MWGHPATQENLARLRARGILTIGPDDGDMACGEEGTGRLSDPQDIVTAALCQLGIGDGALSGRHALVTSGPTVEPIDPVRYIANRSSGKQGHAIAAALARQGARVTLVSGPVTLPPPASVDLVEVETARQMLAACEAALPADIAVCAAAVADWHVAAAGAGKLKKQDGAAPPHLALSENPDILKTLSAHAKRPQLVVGFAAETESLYENAAAKLARKGCDWIVANQVSGPDGEAVFGSDSNAAMLLTGNETETWPRMPKTEIAARLAARIGAHFA
jgi:phosphopantothenoylcysteine decarboxylase/phosphopantothenate--cysteine ligase